jgi:hypothetical protein
VLADRVVVVDEEALVGDEQPADITTTGTRATMVKPNRRVELLVTLRLEIPTTATVSRLTTFIRMGVTAVPLSRR